MKGETNHIHHFTSLQFSFFHFVCSLWVPLQTVQVSANYAHTHPPSQLKIILDILFIKSRCILFLICSDL